MTGQELHCIYDEIYIAFALGASKNAHLKVLEGAEERLQLLKADLMDYNSIASAVAGCEGVFHVASPVLSHRPSNPEVNLSRTSI
jgi:hypothetical protein